MVVLISSEIADSAAQDKNTNSLSEAWGKIVNRVSFFVAKRDIVFCIVNFPDEIIITQVFIREHFLSATVICRRIQTVNKMRGEKVASQHLVFAIRIDEYIGKWGCCITHITALSEQVENAADFSVCSLS